MLITISTISRKSSIPQILEIASCKGKIRAKIKWNPKKLPLVSPTQNQEDECRTISSHSNQPNSVRSQNNLNPYERLKRKRMNKDMSYNLSSAQRLRPSNKYFKDQSGDPQDTSTTLEAAYVCLNKGEVSIRANEIETVVPCDIEKRALPSGMPITRIYPNQQVNILILPM
ncbi:unnamed protein product [Moneuplotes crassus]|uniref:Uncharacterized protein n=1 Tax=Euplotes crassus TaxID=5936 RepID=A0AAD1X6M6_EUPCR|nr:unnamed protein product [Moneuplotes crassus]